MKKLGFNEPVFAIYDEARNNELQFISIHAFTKEIPDFDYARYFYNPRNYPTVLTPTHQQVVDWLRVKHGYDISVSKDGKYCGCIHNKYWIECYQGDDYYILLEDLIDTVIRVITPTSEEIKLDPKMVQQFEVVIDDFFEKNKLNLG